MKRPILAGLVILMAGRLFAGDPVATPGFFVAPDGSDEQAGTQSAPFATIARARTAVASQLAAEPDKSVTVWLRGGRYELKEPLIFGPKFSGTEHAAITYAAVSGEKPVISGGRRITGWQPTSNALWTAIIPEAKGGKWPFRQLFVNDRRAIRARSPNINAAVPYDSLEEAALIENDNGGYQRMLLSVPSDSVKKWDRPGGVEMIIYGEWDVMRKRLLSVSDAGLVVLAPPHVKGLPYNRPQKGHRCYFENALEMLDEPGEWYLDTTTGVLSYWPLPGQDMTRAEVIAPVLTSVLEVRGTGKFPVQNIHFRGLTFSHADWYLPPQGYWGNQACSFWAKNVGSGAGEYTRIDPASRWEFARNCSFEDCRLNHVGGSGLSLERGCVDNLVEGSVFTDIGANGLCVVGANNPATIVQRNRLLNNLVEKCGVDYPGAVGIWVTLTDGTTVSHNEVRDLPYSGISVGWKWDASPTTCKNNIIEYNDIHHFMGILSDGGGIYTLGFQPGTILRGNLVHESAYHGQGTYGSSAFDLDEGSKGMRIEDNITCGAGGIRINGNPNSVTPKSWYIWGTNYFEVCRTETNFPTEVAGQAGLEPEYRRRLREDGTLQIPK